MRRRRLARQQAAQRRRGTQPLNDRYDVRLRLWIQRGFHRVPGRPQPPPGATCGDPNMTNLPRILEYEDL